MCPTGSSVIFTLFVSIFMIKLVGNIDDPNGVYNTRAESVGDGGVS